MAATELTVTQLDLGGTTPSYAAANADGHYFTNDGRVFLQVKNTNGATRTVSIDDPNSISPAAATSFNPDVPCIIPITTGDKLIGPFPVARFGSTVNITFTAVADLTIAAFKI